MWFPKYLEIGINFDVRYLILIQLIYKCNVYSCKTYIIILLIIYRSFIVPLFDNNRSLRRFPFQAYMNYDTNLVNCLIFSNTFTVLLYLLFSTIQLR